MTKEQPAIQECLGAENAATDQNDKPRSPCSMHLEVISNTEQSVRCSFLMPGNKCRKNYKGSERAAEGNSKTAPLCHFTDNPKLPRAKLEALQNTLSNEESQLLGLILWYGEGCFLWRNQVISYLGIATISSDIQAKFAEVVSGLAHKAQAQGFVLDHCITETKDNGVLLVKTFHIASE